MQEKFDLPLPDLSVFANPITKNDIPTNSLSDLFSSNMELSSHKPTSRPGYIQQNKKYTIYPIAHLQELIEHLGECGSSRRTIRFLLDSNLQLWFSLEGKPNNYLPQHWQLDDDNKELASCISSGRIKFLKNTSTIEFINNNSKDFKPSFDSLKWVLAVLISHEKELPINFLPEKIQVQQFNNETLLNSQQIEKKDLIQALSLFIKEKEALIQNQPKEKKHHQSYYQQPSKKRSISSFLSEEILPPEDPEDIRSSEERPKSKSKSKSRANLSSSFFNPRNNQLLNEDLERKPVDAITIKETDEPNIVEQKSSNPKV